MWEKNKGITECDKSTVTSDVGTTQCEDGAIKCEKKHKGTIECDKIESHVMLVLHNVVIVPSNVKKKIREPPNMKKVQSYVMFVLHNVRIVSSNVKNKK